jgi:hypothetical protein
MVPAREQTGLHRTRRRAELPPPPGRLAVIHKTMLHQAMVSTDLAVSRSTAVRASVRREAEGRKYIYIYYY